MRFNARSSLTREGGARTSFLFFPFHFIFKAYTTTQPHQQTLFFLFAWYVFFGGVFVNDFVVVCAPLRILPASVRILRHFRPSGRFPPNPLSLHAPTSSPPPARSSSAVLDVSQLDLRDFSTPRLFLAPLSHNRTGNWGSARGPTSFVYARFL